MQEDQSERFLHVFGSGTCCLPPDQANSIPRCEAPHRNRIMCYGDGVAPEVSLLQKRSVLCVKSSKSEFSGEPSPVICMPEKVVDEGSISARLVSVEMAICPKWVPTQLASPIPRCEAPDRNRIACGGCWRSDGQKPTHRQRLLSFLLRFSDS